MSQQVILRSLLWSVNLCTALIVGIIGCGGDDDNPIKEVDEPTKINLLTTSPEDGGTIPYNGPQYSGHELSKI